MVPNKQVSFLVKATLLILPILIVGYQGCGVGFVSDGSDIGSLSNGPSFKLNITDELGGTVLELNEGLPVAAQINYKFKPTVDKSNKIIKSITGVSTVSAPADACHVEYADKDVKEGIPGTTEFLLLCSVSAVATVSFNVLYEDGSIGEGDAAGTATLSAKSNKDLRPLGVELYGSTCTTNCHGAVASSSKAGKSPDEIFQAIGPATNPKYPGMGSDKLMALTATEIRAIAAALAPPSSDEVQPTGQITAPTNGMVVSGVVTLSATAQDNVGVASVEFIVDGASAGVDTSAPYEVNLDTAASNFSDGKHTVYVKIKDATGNQAFSSTVNFTSKNSSSLNGAQLYQDNGCAGCHGALATSEERGKTRAQLDASILRDQPMKKYSTLSSAERDAIMEALK